MEHIGARIRRFREELGLTQADVYRDTSRIGTPVKQTTLSSIESGTEPKAGVVGAICNAYLNLDVKWLLTGEGDMLAAKPVVLPADPAPAQVTAGPLQVVAESEQVKELKAQNEELRKQLEFMRDLMRSGVDFSKLQATSSAVGSFKLDGVPAVVEEKVCMFIAA